jgi:hypothetical protein
LGPSSFMAPKTGFGPLFNNQKSGSMRFQQALGAFSRRIARTTKIL